MNSTGTEPGMQTGAELLVKSLEAQGVKYIFGIPGAKIDKVFDTLLDFKIKTIVCRHEQNTAFLAGGIGRMTGRAGVVLVTSGPGWNCYRMVYQGRSKSDSSFARKEKRVVKVDDHSTKAKYCVICLYNRTGATSRKLHTYHGT